MKRVVSILVLSLFVFFACDDDSESSDPCAEMTCSGVGECQVVDGEAQCECDQGYTGMDCSECALGYLRYDGDCMGVLECGVEVCSMHGACDDSTGSVVCDCDTGYMGDDCSECAEGFELQGDLCAPIGSLECTDYEFGPATLMDSITFDGECCHDFDGDGDPDNNFQGIIQLFELVTSDSFQGYLDEAVMAGGITKIIEFHGVTGVSDGDLTTPWFTGTPIPDAYYSVPQEEFVHEEQVCTDEPISLFTSTISGNALSGTAPYLWLFNLEIDEDGVVVNYPLNAYDVQMDATLTEDSEGITLEQGTLSGWFPVDDLITYFNDYSAAHCACLGLDGEDRLTALVNEDQLVVTCNTPETNSCTGDESAFCQESTCNQSATLIPNMVDIDSDSDGVPDAISFGAQFTAVPTQINALQ